MRPASRLNVDISISDLHICDALRLAARKIKTTFPVAVQYVNRLLLPIRRYSIGGSISAMNQGNAWSDFLVSTERHCSHCYNSYKEAKMQAGRIRRTEKASIVQHMSGLSYHTHPNHCSTAQTFIAQYPTPCLHHEEDIHWHRHREWQAS